MSTSKSKNIAFVLRPSSFVLRLSCIVVSELPKTATGKVQKYVLRGKPSDFEAVTGLTNQLTDGGPSVTPGLPGGAAGPPFGGALGWAVSWP